MWRARASPHGGCADMAAGELRLHGGRAACVYVCKKNSEGAIHVNTRPKVANAAKNSSSSASFAYTFNMWIICCHE